jgi:protein TonB
MAIREPPSPPAAAPPSPPDQPPPPDTTARPIFGVTMSSVVPGDAPMAVPVGNATSSKSLGGRAAAVSPAPYAGAGAGDGTQPFQPVPETGIATWPHKLYDVNSAEIYPSEAKILGIEGKVKLSVGIDPKGSVVEVRVIERAGHGFDEAAARAMRKFRFSPALTSDGRAVPFRFTYQYTFSIGD